MPRPITEIRIGKVKAAVWKNTQEETGKVYYSVSLSKLYRKNDEWKETSSFSRDDLPLLAKVADQAHTWIFQQS